MMLVFCCWIFSNLNSGFLKGLLEALEGLPREEKTFVYIG